MIVNFIQKSSYCIETNKPGFFTGNLKFVAIKPENAIELNEMQNIKFKRLEDIFGIEMFQKWLVLSEQGKFKFLAPTTDIT